MCGATTPALEESGAGVPARGESPQAARRGWLGAAGWFGLAGVSLSLLALAALQYFMPDSPRFPGPVNPQGAEQFSAWLWGRHFAPLLPPVFSAVFQMLVVLSWISYGLMLWSLYRGGMSRVWMRVAIACGSALLLAFAFPTSLTHDLYAYLGFARMGPLYGLNPYRVTLRELAHLGDIAAVHYHAPHPSVYGPVWTLLSSGIAWAMQRLDLTLQLMALKLVGATSLVAAAFSARAIARVWTPQHADLALLAVAFNPLMLLEGAANGHNDMLMIALLLAGLALVLKGRWQLGCLLLGMSVGVKYVTLAIVPWIVLEHVRGMPMTRALRRSTAMFALVAAAVLVAFLPYFTHGSPLEAISIMYGSRERTQAGAIIGSLLAVILYAIATVWIARGRGDRLAPAWSVWATFAIHAAVPGVLPWYLMWPMGVTLARWDRRQVAITVGVSSFALYWMLHYAVVRS